MIIIDDIFDEVLNKDVLEAEVLDSEVLNDGGKKTSSKSPKVNLNSYYTTDGEYLGFDEQNYDKVFITTRGNYEYSLGISDGSSIKNYDLLRSSSTELPLKNTDFIKKCSAVYGESSIGYNIFSKEEIFAIASTHIRNTIAYGINSDGAKLFRKKSILQRNDFFDIKTAIAAFINALIGGIDYSNGAIAWDGVDQAIISGTSCTESGFNSHAAQFGWTIHTNHYDSWKNEIENLGKVFNAPQHNKALNCISYNEGLYRYESVVQFALTIFWIDRGTGSLSNNPVT